MNKPAHNKHTMKKEILFLGLDVHAKNITIALAAGFSLGAERSGAGQRACGGRGVGVR